jgi:hypothetical protein
LVKEGLRNASAFILHLPIFLEGSLSKNKIFVYLLLSFIIEWKDHGPVADYHMILYMNEEFKHYRTDIEKLLNFDMVVYDNMRPPMGEGNFKLPD